jgi:NAD(P)-dependent dehydrogenase (short-subunit alcohol dehydrogenase family)
MAASDHAPLEGLFDLTGRVALVTGGSSGIGLTISHALATQGAEVAIVNRTLHTGQQAVDEIRARGGKAISHSADVSQLNDVEKAVQMIEENVGPIDILVNCAGINIRKDAVAFKSDEWRQVIETNLSGTFHTCQAVGRRMITRSRGKILNISSIASAIGMKGRVAYCSSKGGVNQLTKALAVEWAPFGINVNAIAPGFIETPLISALTTDAKFQENVKAWVPLGRIGKPRDLIGVVLTLCSDAGAYITGQVIFIDGGWSAC